MAQFTHEHVVRLIGVVTRGYPTLVVCEYMEHGSLHGYLQRHGTTDVTPQMRLQFASGSAKGLMYLHKRGLVHRDVAARNVLLSSELVAKISDFGLSRDTDEDNYYISKGGRLPVRSMIGPVSSDTAARSNETKVSPPSQRPS